MTAAKRMRPFVPLGAEIALAFVAGVTSFVLVAVTFSGLESDVLLVALVILFGAAFVALARFWGVSYAVPAAMAGVLAYDWFQVPPTHPLEFPDSANLQELLVFLGVAVLVGEAAAYAGRRADISEEARAGLLEEQAALRRVATLVAREAPPSEVFTAVTEEVVRLFDVDDAALFRYEDDGEATYVATAGTADELIPVGSRIAVGGENITARVLRTGQPARIEDYADASGGLGDRAKAIGVRGSVGCPIIVNGRLWGVMVAASRSDATLPADTEVRLGEFAELIATAISNLEARREVGRLAEEQAALRRVATLVAREASATEVFAAVAEEVAGLLDVDEGRLIRYENDDTGTVVADWGPKARRRLVGAPLTLEGNNVATLVRRTERAARVDHYDTMSTGAMAEDPRSRGLLCSVGAPVIVEGRSWGAITVGSSFTHSLPAATESRLTEFAELVGTAIANIQARTDLAASRARIVAAADAERRRVVRDLHDGAQQRLVHTIITLKLARGALEKGNGGLELVTQALQHAEAGTEDLRELSHGILPSVLLDGGLRAGVEALVSRMPLPVGVGIDVGRLPPTVEATAYFVVAEALTNVAKHAHADHAEVAARLEDGTLLVDVRDDGVGGVRPEGSGIVGLGDRVAVLDGRLRVESPPDGGTLISAAIPLPADTDG